MLCRSGWTSMAPRMPSAQTLRMCLEHSEVGAPAFLACLIPELQCIFCCYAGLVHDWTEKPAL